ncbi:MAG: ABC transporter permease [Puniceicoccaceae bacterium]
MDSFKSDFLYAFRIFFKRPGLTLLAILALALSLGMSTAAFSSLNGMFFKPLPFKDAEQLHQIYIQNEKADLKEMPIPYENVADLENMGAFSEVMAFYTGTINISGRGRPARYDGAFISINFLDMLGYEAVVGRGFSQESTKADGPRELLISHEMWQDKFRADPDIEGTELNANGDPYTVVGVLPEGFLFPISSHVWMPLNEEMVSGESKQLTHVLTIGRIADGRSMLDVQEALTSTFSDWTNRSMENKEELSLLCRPFGQIIMNDASNSYLVAITGAIIFVLFVSCANVANLLVGRALTRGRELAIRSAVGASRSRVIRQLLTESLVLSFFGAIGGVIYAAWAVDFTMESPIYKLPYWMNFELDWRVFLFVFVIMILTALISGLFPALQASKVDLNEMLKDTSHTSTGFRLGKLTRLLAVIQIAFSCALLFGAGLVTRNVYQMSNIDPGYANEDILTMRMGLFPAAYPTEAEKDAFFTELARKTSQIPGVEGSAVTSWIGAFGNYREPVLLPSADSEQPEIAYAYTEFISPGYFETFNMEILEGRNLNAGDTQDSQRVAIVNEAFVRKYLADADPLELELNLLKQGNGQQMAADSKSLKIVGVVPTIRVSDFTKVDEVEPIIYMPFTQSGSNFMSLALYSPIGDMEELTESVQQVILSLDPNLPVYFVKTMEGYVEEQIYPFQAIANSFLAIGLMALFLAAIGVYGMLAFTVSNRSREIGIRMALGANTITIVFQMLRQGFIQVVLGIFVGSGLAYLVGQITKGFLFGINPTDPSVYIGVLLTLIGVSTLAFFLPARRAARLSPMEALRYE